MKKAHLLLIALAAVLIAAAPAYAEHNKGVKGPDRVQEDCANEDGDPVDTQLCVYDKGGHLKHIMKRPAGARFDGPSTPSWLPLLLLWGIFWAGLPVYLGFSIAVDRDQPVGFAILVCLIFGWLGLLFVYTLYGQGGSVSLTVDPTPKRTPATLRSKGSQPAADDPATLVAHGGVAVAEGSVAERLRSLEELRGEGLLDDEEYAEQRARILNDL